MFHKILIASDGSDFARNAALLASEIARHFGSQIIVVNVFDISAIEHRDTRLWTYSVPKNLIDSYMQGQLTAAESVVRPLLAPLRPPYRMIQEAGHPVAAILTAAEREHVDLIVLGSRGVSALKEFFLGSVANGVLRHAHCPVLIERGLPRLFRRILLASDGSAWSEKAATAAFALAKSFGACLNVLNVNEHSRWLHPDASDPHPVKTLAELQECERRCQSVEATVQPSATETGVHYHICEERGHAGEAIVRYADNENYDLIVMGKRGRGGFERLLLGSVSNYVASHAQCPVLVVR